MKIRVNGDDLTPGTPLELFELNAPWTNPTKGYMNPIRYYDVTPNGSAS